MWDLIIFYFSVFQIHVCCVVTAGMICACISLYGCSCVCTCVWDMCVVHLEAGAPYGVSCSITLFYFFETGYLIEPGANPTPVSGQWVPGIICLLTLRFQGGTANAWLIMWIVRIHNSSPQWLHTRHVTDWAPCPHTSLRQGLIRTLICTLCTSGWSSSYWQASNS